MSKSYELSDSFTPQQPVDHMYFTVIGFSFGIFFLATGGTMAYLAWTQEMRDDYYSVAEEYGIPTVLISLVFLSVGGLLVLVALVTLAVTRCDFSKPQPKFHQPTYPEIASSTAILTVSRDTLDRV